MGLFDMFMGKGIDVYAVEAGQIGAQLVDVREPAEFKQGHIKGALNIPLSTIPSAEKKLPQKDEALYVYCLSGGRSGRACSQLKAMGYTNVTNIGGISGYTGPVVTGSK